MFQITKNSFLGFFIVGTFLSGHAPAAVSGSVDFVAQSLSFQRRQASDISGGVTQRFALKVKNAGTTNSRYPGVIMRILLNGIVLNGNLYGPSGQLNSTVKPGETGTVLFEIPLSTYLVKHCERVAVQIDADRTYQFGGDVFANDSSNLVAVDRNGLKLCTIPPIHSLERYEEALDSLELE